MTRSTLRAVGALLYTLLTAGLAEAQNPTSTTGSIGTATISGVLSTFSAQFTVPSTADRGATLIPNVRDPEAVDAQTVCPGYRASNVTRGTNGFSAILTLAGEPCNVYGTDIETLTFTVEYQSADRLSVNIQPAYLAASNLSQYIPPAQYIPRPSVDEDASATTQTNDFQFVWSNDPVFSFTVIRKSTGDVVFTTEGSVLVYENQFIEFVSALPENYNLYGLGERIHSLRLGNNFSATIYAADAGDPIDYNIYGSHPIYYDTRYFEVDSESGNMTLFTGNESDSNTDYVSYTHGVFLRNTHGQEVVLKPENVTWRTLGGSIDLFFFSGPSIDAVAKQYQYSVTGLPAMQQYWTFGFHQCRWGYKNWTQLQEVVDNFRNFDLPLETIWADIDYMNQYRDFTTDNVTFPLAEGLEFFSNLHADGQHFMPIVDAAIYIPNPENESDAYATYTRGQELDVFLDNPDGSQYIGTVWPGYTVFPDWFTENAVAWWVNEMVQWYRDVQYDGFWIDMNEVASFCVGSCGSGNLTLNPVHPPFKLPGEEGAVIYEYPEGFNLTNATEAASASAASSSQAAASMTAVPTETDQQTSTSSTTPNYLRTTPTPGVRDINHPPYVINNVHGDLAVHAVSPNATHVDGTVEYDVHNIWGHQILNATYQGLLAVFPGKRPFIIGRSTFPGSGKWSGHWGGDNGSKWYYMYFGIPQALSFQLFGIPMFGVDTCGFNGNTDMELCARWMQLSAFFPFYRNHNVLSAIPQEPYVWSAVLDASKTAMNIRYHLLPYMYTLFHQSHTTGSTVMRALAWEFPNEPYLADADRQFLLGPSLMVTPVLEQGASSVGGVFPGVGSGEVWYDWYSQAAVTGVSAGQNVTIPAPLGHIPLYVRGGSVLPLQEPGYTTALGRRNPWGLLVALSKEGTATGQLYIDDGESLVQNATLLVDFAAVGGALYASARGEFRDANPLANVTVMGLSSAPGNVTLNGHTLSSGVSFNQTSGLLTVTGLRDATSEGAWSSDWVLRWT
ncbi:hypothetical protein H2201_001505 [Coniosporium apollinis]|uniref:alpha-glucosidase n=1 Tax=Coniosporium apollinis TaxID=61459 RepID=A0ABQ9P274_9PEZI|nr:hypothetical protein H2201_001505 [Coniosporium apollinis]